MRGSSVISQVGINQFELKLLWSFSLSFNGCQLSSLIIKTSNRKLYFWAAWEISRNIGTHFVFEKFALHPHYKSVPVFNAAQRGRKHLDRCCVRPPYLLDFNPTSALVHCKPCPIFHDCYYRDMYVAFTFHNFASVLITHHHLPTNLKVVSDYNITKNKNKSCYMSCISPQYLSFHFWEIYGILKLLQVACFELIQTHQPHICLSLFDEILHLQKKSILQTPLEVMKNWVIQAASHWLWDNEFSF